MVKGEPGAAQGFINGYKASQCFGILPTLPLFSPTTLIKTVRKRKFICIVCSVLTHSCFRYKKCGGGLLE